MNHFVYMVECADGTLYCGYTTDLERRITEHNGSLHGAQYTKNRRPVVLRYWEKCASRSEAQKREYGLKQLRRQDKLELIK